MVWQRTSPGKRQEGTDSQSLSNEYIRPTPSNNNSTDLAGFHEKPKTTKRTPCKQQQQHRNLAIGLCLMVGLVATIHLWGSRGTFYHSVTSLSGTSTKESLRLGSLNRCSPEDITVKRIVIVGAGAAGLTAAKRLQNAPFYASSSSSSCWTVQVTIVEATSRFGGRVGKDDSFTVYPIDIGASWVFDDSRLSIIAQEPGTETMLKDHLVPIFQMEGFQAFKINGRGHMKKKHTGSNTRDKLWANFTWYDFLEQKVASALRKDQFVFDCPVDKITLRKERGDVALFCGGQMFLADHVIMTASLAVLQDGLIDFQPPLPSRILKGRDPMYRGFKIFFEFSERFYKDYLDYSLDDGELDWWDYSLVHMGSKGPNILSGYYMGDVHDKFEGMTENEVVQKVLQDLDGIYGNGVATKSYVRHKLVYWKDFPYVRGTYARDTPPPTRSGPQVLYDGRLLIAGEAFPVPPKHNGWVDGAALSGLHAAEIILQQIDSSIRWFSIPKRIWEDY